MKSIREKLTCYKIAIQICEIIEQAGGQIRFVGGCVRDLLLNREVMDIDLATNLPPEKIQEILSKNRINFLTIGIRFGTITAIKGEEKIEITTLRRDLECDGRHALVEFTDDWQEDAKRRDFTINALSADLNGNIFDYFNGLDDLRNNKVRFIGIAEERIREDYLRILRFFRFSAYFAKKLDYEGLIAINKNIEKLKNISVNRINNELSKIFIAPRFFSIAEVMQNILHFLFSCNDKTPKLLLKFGELSKNFKFKYSPLECFAIIFRCCKDQKNIIKNFAFSKKDQLKLTQLINSKIKNWDYENLKQEWRNYKSLFKEVVLINLTEVEIDSLLTSNLNKLFLQEEKPLPIKGEDLIKLGIEPGEDLGKLLVVADQIWFDQEFKISKKELLKKIYEHSL